MASVYTNSENAIAETTAAPAPLPVAYTQIQRTDQNGHPLACLSLWRQGVGELNVVAKFIVNQGG